MGEVKQENNVQKKKNKTRMILVILFLIIFAIGNYISLRGSYLEYKELGENYINIYQTNLKCKYIIMGINFVFLYIVMYFTNIGIKKGLKEFFDEEKKKMPKLLNKSLSLVIAAIGSVVVSNLLLNKILLLSSNTSFGITDPIFNLDISYYMFIKPIIEFFIIYFIGLIIGLTIYMILYYIIVFNIHFDGIDRKTLKQSKLMKKGIRNLKLVTIGIALLTLLNTQNIVLQKFITLENDVELTGAGFTESTVKLWGYRIFAVVIVASIFTAIKYFKQSNMKKVLISLATLPVYLVSLFFVMVIFDAIFVNSNELDKEKQYIAYNIDYTKNAYGINIKEENLNYSGTITVDEVDNNGNILNNITIINTDAVVKALEDSQTNTGYYTYRNANIGKYNIDGKEKLVYLSPREISSGDRTYNNKTYEYTHGYGEIITSASKSTETGNVEYVQKATSSDKIKISQPRIYFGLETDGTIVTNTKNKSEYDYTDESGKDYEYSYNGKAGLSLGFLDRIVLAIKEGNINLAFSNSITNDSKILINRNIRERAKKALPYLLYDENPYSVIDDNGNIIWVLDAYTVSSDYPYSSYSNIIYNGSKQKINYIRNSVKVLINSYDGTMKFYITDRTDPIVMAYRNTYKTLFEDIDSKIPEDVSKNFIYPQYLYNIQSKMITLYHNVKPDVLYRSDDIWEQAKYNTTMQTTKATGTVLNPYYTMLKTTDSDKDTLGLVQTFTPSGKQNIISYLVGSYEDGTSKLKLYKYASDNNILGPMQLDTQISQDETISKELDALNVTGTKITKQMIIVPIQSTLLYVEPIYQTMINESDVPVLKKIIVASGNKVAIGNNINEAIKNLLSQYAVDIEVENTDDLQGLIDAIIKANNNLTESNKNNDWEMMGSDIKKLQGLVNSLEKLQEEEKKSKKNSNTTNNTDTNETNSMIDENIVVDTNTSR